MSVSKVGRVLASPELPAASSGCGGIEGNNESKSSFGFAGKNENSRNGGAATGLAGMN
jgi:hypothetical protein